MGINQTTRKPLLIINLTLAILWIYQGLIPKVLYQAMDEQRIWRIQGFDDITMLLLIQLSGYAEIIFGLLFFIFKIAKILHYFNILAMISLSLLIILTDPLYFSHTFNPFVMNLAMAALSIVALS